MVNYNHRFIPQCAAKLTPLNNLLTAANDGHTRLSSKSNFVLKWDENAESAFSESKQILANATLLVHPDPMAQLNITCDASDVAFWWRFAAVFEWYVAATLVVQQEAESSGNTL